MNPRLFSFHAPDVILEAVNQLTREEVQGRKEKAVRFTRDVLGDPERSAEIADESLESYADRKGFQIVNPRRGRCGMATKEQLQNRIEELEQENEDLLAQIDDVLDILSPSEDEDENGSNGHGYVDDDLRVSPRWRMTNRSMPDEFDAMGSVHFDFNLGRTSVRMGR